MEGVERIDGVKSLEQHVVVNGVNDVSEKGLEKVSGKW